MTTYISSYNYPSQYHHHINNHLSALKAAYLPPKQNYRPSVASTGKKYLFCEDLYSFHSEANRWLLQYRPQPGLYKIKCLCIGTYKPINARNFEKYRNAAAVRTYLPPFRYPVFLPAQSASR